MEPYDSSFFCHNDSHPHCHITLVGDGLSRTIVIRLNNDPDFDHYKPSVTIHIESEQAAINFKNSVLWAFEKFMRKEETA